MCHLALQLREDHCCYCVAIAGVGEEVYVELVEFR